MCTPRTEFSVPKMPHHVQQEICLNRPPYRQGRKYTAVKVYTVNDESQHLLVFGVPKIQLQLDLRRLATRYGEIKSFYLVRDYEDEVQFTETYHVSFKRIQAARFAKRQMDGRSFFGGILHVCYAPELETKAETRMKLVLRRKEVSSRLKANEEASSSDTHKKTKVPQRTRKHPAIPPPEGFPVTQSISLPNEVLVIKPSMKLLQGPNSQGETSKKNRWQAPEVGVKEQYLIPHSSPRSTSQFSMANQSNKPNLPSQLSTNEVKSLRFVPRSVAATSVNKIVFHKKRNK